MNEVAKVGYDDLIKSAGAIKLIDITAKKDLKKGTILDSTGAVYAGGDADPAFILAQDVIASDAAQTVEVWQEGIFFRETIETAMGYTITAADELKLRKNNFTLESII